MAYKMEYEQQHGIPEPIARKWKNPRKRLTLLGIVIASSIALMIPAVRDCLIPGDAQVTKTAASQMIQSIENGEGVVEAFAEFCQQIIQNG